MAGRTDSSQGRSAGGRAKRPGGGAAASADIATLAHDIRNSLNILKGAVVYVQTKYGREQSLAEFCGIMEQELVKLTAAAAGIGYLPAAPASTDINDLIKQIVRYVGSSGAAAGIRSTCVYGDLPRTTLDAFVAGQLIMDAVRGIAGPPENGAGVHITTSRGGTALNPLAIVEIRGDRAASRSARLPESGAIGFDPSFVRRKLKQLGGAVVVRGGAAGTMRLCFPTVSGKEWAAGGNNCS